MTILTKLIKKDFDKILENYSIGKYKSHKHIEWALQNTVYVLKTTKGKYILKIFEKTEPSFINYQIKIVDFLHKHKVPVARISKLKDRTEVLIYNKKHLIIQKFLEGNPREIYSEKLLMNVAKNFGKMSKSLLELKLKEINSNWKENHQFKRFKSPRKPIPNFNWEKEVETLNIKLKSLQKSKLKKGIIHGDFHGINILIKNNKIKAIIDFDDAHKDYLAYEIAVFMIDPLITNKKFKKKLTKIFFKEYKKYIKLNKEEKEAIYYFIKHRILGIIAWDQDQIEKHPDHKIHLVKGMNKMIAKYQTFDKVSLNEFLKILK